MLADEGNSRLTIVSSKLRGRKLQLQGMVKISFCLNINS